MERKDTSNIYYQNGLNLFKDKTNIGNQKLVDETIDRFETGPHVRDKMRSLIREVRNAISDLHSQVLIKIN